MTLKELRINKKLTRLEASFICGVPVRTYKRLENDSNFKGTYKYEHVYSLLNNYVCKKNENIESKTVSVVDKIRINIMKILN